jgi:uncharacterized protein YifE (UPF0438 family)
VELTKDDRTYRLAFRTLADYALKEAAIVQTTGSPYNGLESIADSRVRSEAFKIAADIAARPLIATMEDEERFDRSFRGLAWSVWRALSVNHPDEFPPNASNTQGIQLGCDFIAWFGDVRRIVEAVHKVEQKDALGN